MPNYILSIPEPCGQNWNDMTPNKNGRHCLECNKIVVDFTHMNNEEIVRYLLKNEGACGRIKAKSLEIPIQLIAPFRNIQYKWPAIAAMLITGMFLVSPIYAQNTPQKIYDRSMAIPKYPQEKTHITADIILSDSSATQSEEKKDSIIHYSKRIIKGKIIEKGTEEPIPFCNVLIEINDILMTGQVADIDGKFSIKLPETNENDKIELITQSVGLIKNTTVLAIDPQLFEKELVIEVKAEDVILMGFIIQKSDENININPEDTKEDHKYDRKKIMSYPGQ